MKLGYSIAMRFLKSNKGQTFLIILGIAIGVSVQIFIGSLIQGLQKGLIEKTIGDTSQITVQSATDQKEIEKYDAIIESIRNTSEEIEYISVASDHAAFLQVGEQSQSVLVRGFELSESEKIYNMTDNLVGDLPLDANEILLGIDLKEEYQLQIGDTVELITTKGDTQSFTISGFFDLKVSSVNKNWAVTNLATAQDLFQTGDTVTSVETQLEGAYIFDADVIATKITSQLPEGDWKVDNWKVQNEQLLSGLQGQSISSLMIQVFVLISVVLGIASVLAITVMQKSRQIGILKAMGIKTSTTAFVFLFEGLILGFFGAVLGILFGLGLALSFTTFAVNADGTPVVNLFISLPFILGSGTIAVLASVLAALVPAIRSSRLNPIDIIRNN